MSKLFRFFLILQLFPLFVKSQYTMIPDSAFESLLVEFEYDSVFDGKISNDQAALITRLDFGPAPLICCINSLEGISAFKNLEELFCGFQEIEKIDLTQNKKLRILDLFGNNLDSLVLNNNVNLEWLQFSESNLSYVDVSKCVKLKSLFGHTSKLKSINLNNNSLIEELSLENNKLQSLDLRNLTNLKSLGIHNNNISFLDISNCSNLDWTLFSCYENEGLNCDSIKEKLRNQ